jgi:inhibitor of KinA sporulation pathway (predicted exonuclease)
MIVVYQDRLRPQVNGSACHDMHMQPSVLCHASTVFKPAAATQPTEHRAMDCAIGYSRLLTLFCVVDVHLRRPPWVV